MLDLPPSPSKFSNYYTVLRSNLMDVSHGTMRTAAREATQEHDGYKDITVALDGTWQKRGHGVVVATSADTGKVIDFEILTKHCRGSKLNNHKCVNNYKAPVVGWKLLVLKNSFLAHSMKEDCDTSTT